MSDHRPSEVVVRKRIAGKPSDVFRAWVEPERFSRWFAPKPMIVGALTIDARPGGAYEIEISGPSNGGKCAANSRVRGRFLVVDPGERLSFTWFASSDPFAETIVTLEFAEIEGGTELRLTHSGFADAASRERHAEGWEQSLANLAEYAGRDVNAASYFNAVQIKADRAKVFAAIATPEGVRGWWTPLVNGEGVEGGQLRLEFAGLDERIDLRVDRLAPPCSVEWTCLDHSDLPEWAGTRLHFDLLDLGPETTQVNFAHIGLHPRLECYDHCKIGWGHFLASIAALVETGSGHPFVGRGAP